MIRSPPGRNHRRDLLGQSLQLKDPVRYPLDADVNFQREVADEGAHQTGRAS